MKTVIEILILFILTTVFLLLYGLHFTPNQSYINQTIRPLFLTHENIRKALKLNLTGDLRYFYAQNTKPLNIVVWYDPKFPPPENLKNWLTGMILTTVNRQAQVDIKPLSTLPTSLSDSQLNDLLKAYPATTTDLRLFLVGEASQSPTNAGLVLGPDSLFLFLQTIQTLTPRTDLQDKLIQSTVMHEWGHLLGLEHLNQESCIMSERVEVYANRLFQGANLPTSYCPDELYLLKRLTHV